MRTKIGILGAGQLGLPIALALINKGIKQSNILLSYAGDPLTLRDIKKAGLINSLTNLTLAKLSNLNL